MDVSEPTKLGLKANKLIPGGVNSPVRSWKAVGGKPFFVEKASGSRLYNTEGEEYIDYVMAYGPLILGHAHPEIVAAVSGAARAGTIFGQSTRLEVELAEKLVSLFSGIQKIRLVNSGTEAVMTALRLARAYTGKDKILKFDGCYHGHCDSMLVRAGAAGIPSSKGVSGDVAKNTLSIPYNNLEAFEETVREEDYIGCVIVEPVAANMGLIPPKQGFLKGLREITEEHDIILVFDEVVTGFRLCYGGAQDYYGVKPDLTCLGKIIGGGLPIGAVGGREDIMDLLAPVGGVYQAGTMSGNPIAVCAGLATLSILDSGKAYDDLKSKTALLSNGVREAASERGINVYVSSLESLMSVFFSDKEVYSWESAGESNKDLFASFFREMISQGVFIPPSPFESWFTSQAHTSHDITETVNAVHNSFKELGGV